MFKNVKYKFKPISASQLDLIFSDDQLHIRFYKNR